MAFTDPQSITVNAVAKSMPRISDEASKSLYSMADETFKMTISHQPVKDRYRHMVRVDQRAVVVDPLTAASDYESLGIYLVIDRPNYGFDVTAVDNVVQAFKAWLTTANVTKVFGLEH